MEVARATLWTVLMVMVVTSRPVCLHVEDDSSKSSESRESMSSEETDVQPALTDTGMQGDNLASSPPSSTLDTAAVPLPEEDPQTSTDIDSLQPLPENPCQTAFHVDNSHNTDTSVIRSTKKPKCSSASEGLQEEATPPVPLQIHTPTPLWFSTDTPFIIPAEETPATTAEPAPPRGDI